LVPLAGDFSLLLGVSLLIGLGNGLGSGTMMTLGADLAPVESRGEFLGMWRFVGDFGNAGGPLVVGHIADLAGLTTAPLIVAGIGLIGAMILGGLVPETLDRGGGR
jgi:MFS family permease